MEMSQHSSASSTGDDVHGHGHGVFFCDGEPVMTEGGSWIGHFLPGLVFAVWATHWLQGTYRNYFAARRTKGLEYRAQTTYGLGPAPPIAESICKLVLPLLAMGMELYFAHSGGWRTLLCPAGTPRAGHFHGPHLGNWQHAAMYPAFALAGLVDLVAYEVELPPGTQQVMLFFAFLCEALLMGLHKKHLPLDTAVHFILFLVMAANAAVILLEAVHPRAFLVSCGRVAATYVQAGWFWCATHMLFEGRPAWDDMAGGDMAPMMMAPVVFVMVIVAVLAGMVAAFVVFGAVYKVMDSRAASGSAYERAGLLDEPADAQQHHPHPHPAGSEGKGAGAGAVALAALHSSPAPSPAHMV